MTPLDPRRNAFRPDVADSRLRGQVEAERFADGEPHRVKIPVLPVVARPGVDFPMTTQALMGEDLRVFAADKDWAFVQLARDGYVGYVRRAALARECPAMTHRVSAQFALCFEKPDIKSQQGWYIPFGAGLSGEMQGDFLAVAHSGYVPRQHIAAIGQIESDFVAVAERFVGVPYLWGGKTAFGIDCSGLVQLAMQGAGLKAPRDSDMQAAEIGELLPPNDWARVKRGDLVFWRGHVGIMCDADMIVHANAHHMAVTREPLLQVRARADAKTTPIVAVRRL